jgi:hypothetical protein
MVSIQKTNNDLNKHNLNQEDFLTEIRASISPSDPQVKAKQRSPKRFFTAVYKSNFLHQYDACLTALERCTLLRREALTHSRVACWKQEQTKGKYSTAKKQNKQIARVDHLSREVLQLKKKLAQAEAVIDLQKKVSELLGTHILPLENNEMDG